VPASFDIDPNISDAENIKAFLDYLKVLDADMASALERHIAKLIPLPPVNQPQRARVRTEFNSEISNELDAL